MVALNVGGDVPIQVGSIESILVGILEERNVGILVMNGMFVDILGEGDVELLDVTLEGRLDGNDD